MMYYENRRYVYPFYLVLSLTILIMLIGESTNKFFILMLGTICWLTLYIFDSRFENKEFAIVRILIYSLPLSFTNIFGQSYALLPLSWFNIFLVITILMCLFKNFPRGKFYFNSLSIISLYLIGIGLVPLMRSSSLIDSLIQYLNTIIPLVIILIGNNLKFYFTRVQLDKLVLDYISATKIAALGVFIQIFIKEFIGKEVGFYLFLGGYRHAFGFLFSDFSFLSLYLASGAIMLIAYKGALKVSFINKVFELVLLLSASIFTSARTGIVAFIAVILLISFIKLIKLILKGSLYSIFIVPLNIFFIFASYILVLKTRGDRALSDSGRSELNEIAFNVFLDNIFFGIGFGKTNYVDSWGMLPHNIIFQSLAQGGLFYTVPLMIFLAIVLIYSYKINTAIFMAILSVVIGALFIPNVFNSRYLAVLFLLLALMSRKSKKKFQLNYMQKMKLQFFT